MFEGEADGYDRVFVTFADRKMACIDSGESGESGSISPIQQSHPHKSWTLCVCRGLATGRFARNIFFGREDGMSHVFPPVATRRR